MQRTIELATPAKRIVSLVPSQTELLFAMGAGESVVGITKFCTEPSESVAVIKKVGGTKQFDFAAIAALKPDLIIGNKEENYPEGIEQLAQDYPVWMSDIVTLEDSLAMIRGLGELSGKVHEAAEMANTISNRFNELRDQSFPPAKVAYFIWQKPYMVAGGDTFIDDMLQYGGMHNAFATTARYPEITTDELVGSEVEVILLSSEPFPFREKHLQAFQAALPDKKIILVDAMPFSWYGSQLLRTPAYLRELRTKF
ncbi:MAG: helical backbone metal receptor [Leucothrix sp.]